jgi:hypothetical protein
MKHRQHLYAFACTAWCGMAVLPAFSMRALPAIAVGNKKGDATP